MKALTRFSINTSEGKQEPSLPDFTLTEARIFTEKGGKIYIGGVEVSKEIRDILREQAKYIERSQFWEIFNATITQEAAMLALIQSTEWEHIHTAKMLHHWAHVFRNMLNLLAK